MQIDLYQFGDPCKNLWAAIISMALYSLSVVEDNKIKKESDRKHHIIRIRKDKADAINFFKSHNSNLSQCCENLGWDIGNVRKYAKEVENGNVDFKTFYKEDFKKVI